jgi:hypothetical protein
MQMRHNYFIKTLLKSQYNYKNVKKSLDKDHKKYYLKINC